MMVWQDNYRALCRGEQLLPASSASRLMCRYTVPHPWYTLHPVGAEQLHGEPHPVTLLHRVLTSQQCHTLAGLAARVVRQSAVGQDKGGSSNIHGQPP